MNRKTVPYIAIMAIFALPGAQAQEGEGFYDRKAEGWFWYAPEPEPVEEPEPEEPPEPVAAPPSPVEEVTTTAAILPKTFSAAWFRDNMQHYIDAAWDDPTVENVRTFLYLQRIMMDRSEQFADTAELALTGDPMLDEVARRPLANFASEEVDRQAGQARKELVGTLAEKAGIFFFFSSECEFCESQAPIVKMLENAYGYTVIPVSVDGKPLNNGVYPDFRTDTGQAQMFGVQTLPAMFLVTPDGEHAAISQGAISLPEFNHRILIAALRSGWITQEEFNTSRPILNLGSNLAEAVQDPGEELDFGQDHQGEQDGFIPPAAVLKYIESRIKGD